jgi:predicted MFS family arabinose efflux permease
MRLFIALHAWVRALGSREAGPGGSTPLGAMFAIAIISCAGFSGMLLLPLIVSAPINAFGVSEAAAGKFGAAELLAIACSSTLLAPRVASIRPKHLICAGLVLIIAASALAVLAPYPNGYMLSRILSGIGEGLVLTAAHAIVAKTAGPDRVFAVVNFTVLVLGAASYPYLSAAVAHKGIAPLAVASAVLALIAAFSLPLLGEYPAVGSESESIFRVAKRWRRPLCGILCFYVAEGALWGYLLRLGIATGKPPQWAGEIISGAFLLSLLGPLIVYWLNLKAGRRIPLVVSTALLCITAAVFAVDRTPEVFKIATFELYLVFIVAITYSSGLMAAIDPSGRLVAAVPGVRTFGMGVGPALSGLLMPEFGVRVVGWVAAIGYALAVGLFAATSDAGRTPSSTKTLGSRITDSAAHERRAAATGS